MIYIHKSIVSNLKIVILILFYFIAYSTYGIDYAINSKYPFVLINDDHGILTEAELADESYGQTIASASNPISSIHWKCYRTDGITINYRVMEYSKEHGEDVADLNINAIDEKGIVNQYGMRRGLGVTYCEETSKVWEKLMKEQEYVCINGHYTSNEIELYNGKKQQVIGWVFNKLKTKNGCNNYFASRDCAGKAIDLR